MTVEQKLRVCSGEDAEDVVSSSLGCRFDDNDVLPDDLKVRMCNGEQVQVGMIEDTFEMLDGLTNRLTDDNYENLETDINVTDISGNIRDILSSLGALEDSRINSDGTDEEYMNSVSSYLDNWNSLLSDLDMDGSYTEESEQLTEAVDTAWTTMQSQVESSDESSDEQEPGTPNAVASSDDNSIEWWVWLIIAIAIAILALGVYIIRRNRNMAIMSAKLQVEGAGAEGSKPRTTGGGEI